VLDDDDDDDGWLDYNTAPDGGHGDLEDGPGFDFC